VDLAMSVMHQIRAKGRVVRGWIGVLGRIVTPQLAESFGLRVHSGVLVSSTMEKSPAERAGIHAGDVISKVDGQAIATTYELLEAVASAGLGASVELEVWRGSKRLQAHATTIERPRMSEQP
jgi:S1-C subfamily serine protease